MARSKINTKADPISASVFKCQPPEALARICMDTAAVHPRFSWAIAKMGPPEIAFDTGADRRGSFSDRDRCPFTEAISSGQLAYARLLAARLALAGYPSNDLRLGTTGLSRGIRTGYQRVLRDLLRAPVSSAKVLRSRSWLWAHCGGGAKSQHDLASEAHLAFSLGRPKVALAICRELLSHAGSKLCEATANGVDLPASAHQMSFVIASGHVDHAGFVSALARQPSGRDDPLHTRPDSFERASLLSLGAFWASKLAASSSPPGGPIHELARGVALAMNQLWAQGAGSSPLDHAVRFAAAPYPATDPRAHALRNSAAMMAPLWLLAAQRPKAHCGSSILWDAFVAAHADPEVLGVDPNPFALLPSGQSAALWSLSGDGSLISLGISRGFDPRPTEHMLVHPGSMGKAFSTRGDSLAPHAQHHPLDPHYTLRLCSRDFHIDKARGPRAARPTLGCVDPKSAWIRTNLTSLALFSGHSDAARALAGAGCVGPHATSVFSEVSPSQSDALARMLSAFEDYTLGQEVSDPTARASESMPDPGDDGASAQAPKRRILKA